MFRYGVIEAKHCFVVGICAFMKTTEQTCWLCERTFGVGGELRLT